jgi:hypothetical protein
MKMLSLVLLVTTQVSLAAPNSASSDKTVAAPVAVVNSNEPQISAIFSEKTLEDNKLVQSTELQYQSKKTILTAISHGLRKKKVFGLVPVKVYTIEFLSANPTKLVKTDESIIASLKSSEAAQLKLTLQRDLAGAKITQSFTESLENNGVDVKNPSKEMAEVMAELNTVKEFKKGETFSLLATWKDSNATLFIQKPDGSITTISGPEKFANELFSIWFGTPADKEMIELKKTLLK